MAGLVAGDDAGRRGLHLVDGRQAETAPAGVVAADEPGHEHDLYRRPGA